MSMIATIFSVPLSYLERKTGVSQGDARHDGRRAGRRGRQEVSLSAVVLPQANQDVVGGEVLPPGRVEDAVSRRQDPLAADEAGAAQELLGTTLIQHHLPADR